MARLWQGQDVAPLSAGRELQGVPLHRLRHLHVTTRNRRLGHKPMPAPVARRRLHGPVGFPNTGVAMRRGINPSSC